MRSDSIVDSRLSINLSLQHSLGVNALFLTSPEKRGHLATQLLIYDKVVIPTKDFGIVPILIFWWGLKSFERALSSGALAFLHRKALLGYGGNGQGLAEFVILPSDERRFEWWQDALFGPMAEAIEIQLRVMCPFIDRKQRAKLQLAILSHTTSLEYDNDFFNKNVMHETYADIMSTPKLSGAVSALSDFEDKTDLTRVPGVEENQMVVSNSDAIDSPADLILRIAEVNISLVMGAKMNNADVFVPAGSQELLKAKLERSRISPSALANFVQLLELERIPDVGAAVATGAHSLDEIWEIRRKGASRRFRQWLRGADSGSARDLEKEYVHALGKRSLYEALPVRMLRFAITAVADQLLPLAGTALGAADSFFVEEWLKGYSPRAFFDDLRTLS